jgi:hypothetical protein
MMVPHFFQKKTFGSPPKASFKPQSAAAPHFFTRYVKQAGALPPTSAFPWHIIVGA